MIGEPLLPGELMENWSVKQSPIAKSEKNKRSVFVLVYLHIYIFDDFNLLASSEPVEAVPIAVAENVFCEARECV